MNRIIKLLAVVERSEQGITVGVYPVMLPENHQLARYRAALTRSSWRAKLLTISCSTVAGCRWRSNCFCGSRRYRNCCASPCCRLYWPAHSVVLERANRGCFQVESSYMMRLAADAVGVLARVSDILLSTTFLFVQCSSVQKKTKTAITNYGLPLITWLIELFAKQQKKYPMLNLLALCCRLCEFLKTNRRNCVTDVKCN